MDQKEIERLRRLAGNEIAPEQPEDRSRKNMYEIRQTLNEAAKPDYADIDGDGDKKETMKKAAKDKEEAKESVEEELEEEVDELEELRQLSGFPVNEKSESKSQQRAAGMALSAKRGEMKVSELKGAAKEMYDGMSEKELEDFAETKHKGLPDKVEETADPYQNTGHIKDDAEMMREWSNSVYKQYDDRGHYQEQPEGEIVDLSLRRYLNAEPQKVQLEEDIEEDDMLREYKEFKGKKND